MRTPRSPDNPFGHDRAAFAWENVPQNAGAHLDFGCYEGEFLNSLRTKNVGRLVGVDVCREAIEAGQKRYTGIELIHLTRTIPLPFADKTFDSISMMDVLEHVNDQSGVLNELRRVSRDDGILIVTVPGQYALSILDMGNVKFRFPRMHRWIFRMRHSREEYERRYVSNPDGLIGDISADKAWHEHFSSSKLGALLDRSGFVPTLFDGAGYFMRAVQPFAYVLRPIPVFRSVIRSFNHFDDRFFHSLNLFCVARKAPQPTVN